ncbi:hypothetical protein F4212_01360 [Candidatus Poribacteria bacterium]|nr:hypothetical protein [Candidatus Poribacteria bacterium]
MAQNQRLSAELSIEAGLGSSFRRTFKSVDSHIAKTSRSMNNIGRGFSSMGQVDSYFKRMNARMDQMSGTAGKLTRSLRSGFQSVGRTVSSAFRNTNAQIEETHDVIRSLRRQSRNFEQLADHARSMGKSVRPWLEKIEQVNTQLAKQERRLNSLRAARDRYNRGRNQMDQLRQRVAPMGRRLGYAAAGAAIGGGYAAYRSFETYTNFNQLLNTLRAEGVDQQEIPLISDQILKFASQTRFTATEIGELLVSMKKDGQEVNSEMKGFGDLLKFAVAEQKDLGTAWGVTRTFINATNTELADAIKLQEELSNATSQSKLQIEDFGFIAGKALAGFAGLERWNTKDFLAIAGILADTGVQAETVGITLRRFPLTLAEAAHGKLAAGKQQAFDLLGIDIADEQGRLKEIKTILSEFNRSFTELGYITDENKISTVGLTALGEIFDTRYANAIGQMITGHERISESIDGIGKTGTLDEKFAIHSETLFASQKRFQSAIESLGLNLFKIFDDDENFIRLFDGMTEGVGRFINFIQDHKTQISSFAKGFVDGLGAIASVGIDIGKMIFGYFRDRGSSIKQFLKNFWEDLRGVWETIKPVAMATLGIFTQLLDTLGGFAGGNTKLLAWLAAAFIGWKALQTPILAVNASYNLLAGTFGKLKGAAQMAFPTPPSLPNVGNVGKSLGTKTMGVVSKAAPALGGLLSFLAPVSGAFTGLGATAGSVFAYIGGAIGSVSGILTALGTSILAVVGTITAPVAAVIAAIVAVVGAGVALIVANWEKVKGAFFATVETVKMFGSMVWEIVKFVVGSVIDFFGNFGENVSNIFSGIGNFVMGIFGRIGEFIINNFGGVGKFVVDAFSWTFGIVGKVLGGFFNLVVSIGKGVGSVFGWVFDGLVGGVVGTWNFLKEKVGNFFDWITEKMNWIRDKIKWVRDFFRRKNEERDMAKQELDNAGISLNVNTPDIPSQNVTTEITPNMSALPEYKQPNWMLPEVPEYKQPKFEQPNFEQPNYISDEQLKMSVHADMVTPDWTFSDAYMNVKAQSPKIEMENMTQQVDFKLGEMPDTQLVNQEAQVGRSVDSMSAVEYVEFSGVDDLTEVTKAGFKTLTDVNSEILNVLKQGNFASDMSETTTTISEKISDKTATLEKITDNTTTISEKTATINKQTENIETVATVSEKTATIDKQTEKIEKASTLSEKTDTLSERVSTVDKHTENTEKVSTISEKTETFSEKTASLEKISDNTTMVTDKTNTISKKVATVDKQTENIEKVSTISEKTGTIDKQTDTIEKITTTEVPSGISLPARTPEDGLVVRTPESGIDVSVPPMPDLRVPVVRMPDVPVVESPKIEIPDAPKVESPEVEMVEQVQIADLQLPALETPQISMPDAPSMEMPDAPSLEMPDAPIIKSPVLRSPELPEFVLDTPQFSPTIQLADNPPPEINMPAPQTTELPALNIPEPQVLENTPAEISNVYEPPPPVQVDVKPIPVPVEQGQQRGDVNNVYHITINQQPGQDSEELLAMLLKEMEKEQRTRYFD